MTEKFKLLGVVVSSQRFLVRLHVQYVQVVIALRAVLQVLSVSPWTGLKCVERCPVNTETWIRIVGGELFDV